MDGARFDDLTRALGARRTRRGAALALLGGIALGAAPASASSRRGTGKGGPGSGPTAAGAKECRYPGMRCKKSKTCCEGASCVGGECTCLPGLIKCGDFCVTEQQSGNYSCCKPYKTPCSFGTLQCCGMSDCTGILDGEQVCCGLEIHPCTKENEAYCCSGRCDLRSKRCEPVVLT